MSFFFLLWIQIFKISFQGSDGKFFKQTVEWKLYNHKFIHERQDGSLKGNSSFRHKTLSYSAERNVCSLSKVTCLNVYLSLSLQEL